MQHVCGYHCPCGATRYLADRQNTVRGGSGQPTISPTVRHKRHHNLLTAAWIMQQIQEDIERQIWRDMMRLRRPTVWQEIQRAAAAAWARFCLRHPVVADIIEGAATGLLMMLPTAAIMAALYGSVDR